MFVYSVKTSRKKLGFLFALFAAGAAILAAVILSHPGRAASSGAVSLRAGSARERLAFISQFGWEVDEDPVQVTEVMIPAEFDEVYTEYAAMQKEQGFDLEIYKGMRAKRWTYRVLNYPGYEQNEDAVELNLLIYEGTVIGGDVCSLELGGFMHGFERPADPTPAASPAAEKVTG